MRDTIHEKQMASTEQSTLLTEDEREAVWRPIEDALTLPNRAFTCEAWFTVEAEKIYRQSWVAYCFEHELPDEGDVMPRDLIDVPLMAVRGTDGKVRVFHNVCPYDSCPVVLEQQHRRELLRVPYHGWLYDLNGRLVGIPYWDGTPEGNLASLGERRADLLPVACETFMGIVFVSLAEQPEAFASYIAPLAEILEPWDLASASPGRLSMGEGGTIFSYEVAANWKTYYENTCVNVLHEAFTHTLYADSPEVPRVHDGVKTYWDHVDRNFLALAYKAEDFANTYPLLDIPHLGREGEPVNAYYGALFPNLHIGIAPDSIVAVLAFPERPDHTTLYESYYFRRDAATDPTLRTAREVLYHLWRMAHLEDQRVIEGVQRARLSPAVNQMFYAPFWDVMHHAFSQMVLEALGEK